MMQPRLLLIGAILSLYPIDLAGAGVTPQYYAIFVGGTKVGYGTHRRHVDDGNVTTTERIDIAISREGTIADVYICQSSVETCDGRPLSFEVNQKVGTTEMAVRGRVDSKGKCNLTITNAGRTNTTRIGWPKGAVMAEGFRLLMLDKGLAEGTTSTVRLFEPASLMARESTVHVGARKAVRLIDRTAELIEIERTWKTLTETVTQLSYVDEDFNSLKVVVPMVGTTCEFVACGRPEALAGGESVDLFNRVSVVCPESAGKLLAARSATYELVPTEENRLTLPSGGSQLTQESSDGHVFVTVRLLTAPADQTLPYAGSDPVALAALADSTFLQIRDPKIMQMTRDIVGDAKETMEAVRRIERFVYHHLDEGKPSLGYAPALDIIAHRTGDCSEHAILTVALCRAIGIPAQVVTGVACRNRAETEAVFVPHAWARVCVGDVWIDVDATGMCSQGVGRIALTYSDGSPGDLLSCLGRFRIARVTVN